MALQWGDIQRLKYETGYNAANVGAELYVLNGYAAVFDAAIATYLFDQATTCSTPVGPFGQPQNVAITLASNPAISGSIVGSNAGAAIYGSVFQVGTKIVVDVGPYQETDVIVQGMTGLVATVQLSNPHGQASLGQPTTYPVILQAGEFLVRELLSRLDVLKSQMKGYSPAVAGLAAADEAKFFASQKGRRGQKGVFDDLVAQRDDARRELCSLLGIENLWETKGKGGGGSAGLNYDRY